MIDRFLERSVGEIAPELVGDLFGATGPSADRIGRLYGPWRVEEPLGFGGMGEVFLVERSDGQYEMRAALKLLAGDPSPGLAERFRLERQILARLDHPHVARLLDGGTTERGEPWFVMEQIEGDRIDDWCDDRDLDVPARLRLFLQVCAAAAHAHRQLVVHRDIKPGNVLIDREGKARLLDFGIAHPVASNEEPRSAPKGSRTALTPGYAAPEQIRGEPASTAADVYALGALLHCLLTGGPPFGERSSVEETIRGTLVEPLPLPSSVVADPRRSRALRGDLDAIVSRALAKDPDARYSTADDLAADVSRFLDDLPVRARPATPAIRLGKAFRRHRLGAAMGVLVVALVVGALLGGFSRMREAERQRERAEKVTTFLTELLEVGDPAEGGRFTVDADQLMRRAFARADTELVGRPELQAAVFHQVGEVLQKLGIPAEAREALTRAIALRRKLAPRGSPELAASLVRYGYSFQNSPRATEGLPPLREAVEISRRLYGEGDPRLADVFFELAVYASRLVPPDSSSPALRREAAGAYEEALEVYRRSFGEAHPKVAETLRNMAFTRTDTSERIELLERAVSAHEAYDPEAPELAYALSDLALVQEGEGRPRDAERALRRSLEILRPREDDDIRIELTIANNLAGILRDQARYAEAAPLYREVLEIRERVMPRDERARAFTLYGLGRSLLGVGETVEAESRLTEAATILEEGGARALAGVAWGWAAEAVAAGGELSSARDLARRGYQLLADTRGEGHEETALARDRVERLASAPSRSAPEANATIGEGD